MDALHAALGWITVATAIVTVVAAVLTARGRLGSRTPLDRAILAHLGAAIAASAVGLALLATGRPLGDPLHAVYAAVAVGAVPVGRYLSRDGPTPRIGRHVAVGGLLVLGALLRLFMTGR